MSDYNMLMCLQGCVPECICECRCLNLSWDGVVEEDKGEQVRHVCSLRVSAHYVPK